MSTIGKIRKRSGLLIVVVGVAMAAFILGDLFSAGGMSNSVSIGEIAGDDVDLQEFDRRVQNEIDAVKQANPNLTEQQTKQIRNQVWNQMVRERIFEPQVDAIGLNVTQEEYNDVRFGENILPSLKSDQTFQDPETGQFNPNTVQQYFVYLQENFPALWQSQKESIIASRIGSKYNTLLKKGIVVNSVEATDAAMASTRRVNIDFVQQKYASIADSLVTVSENDVKTFFNEHKSETKYKQTVNRTADFILFTAEATQLDKNELKKDLARLKSDFQNADNDSDFISRNNEQPFRRAQEYTAGTYPSVDSLILNATAGTVVGPFINGKTMYLTKVVFNGEDKEVNARHILLKPNANNTIEDLKAKADSLMKVAKRKNNFAKLAEEFSEDPGSAVKGGDLDWFGRGQMVPPFEKAAYAAKKGEMTIVESQFGVHLIKVEDNRPKEAIRIASIVRNIAPSNETIDSVYNEASQISIQYNKAKVFLENAGNNNNLLSASNIIPNATFVPGINGNPSEFVRWMYKAELGEVSEPIEIGNQILVAALTQVNEEGEPTFEAVKDQMEREVIKAKKAEMIKAKIKGSTLDEMAKSLDTEVESATELSFTNPTITGAGREPKVVAKALFSDKDKISQAITGENAVIVYKVTSVTDRKSVV